MEEGGALLGEFVDLDAQFFDARVTAGFAEHCLVRSDGLLLGARSGIDAGKLGIDRSAQFEFLDARSRRTRGGGGLRRSGC